MTLYRPLTIQNGIWTPLAESDSTNVGSGVANTVGNLSIIPFGGTTNITGIVTVTGVVNADGGLDRSTTAELSLGVTNATAITLGQTGITTTVHGTLAAKHLVSTAAGTVTIAAGTGAGTSPTVSVTGTDIAGVISVTTGSGSPATDATVATITFGTAYGASPIAVILTPANALTAAIAAAATPFASTITTTEFLITSNGVALDTATAYQWYYSVMG